MRQLSQLKEQLRRIDGRGYRAYKEIAGGYADRQFELYIDHVQGDPFAAPSRLRAIVPQGIAQIPEALYRSPIRQTACADFIARVFASECERISGRRGSGKSGLVDIDRPDQEVLARTACSVTASGVELRFSVGLPAAGRRVLGREAARLLLDDLPALIEASALYGSLNGPALTRHVQTVEDSYALREQLREADLIAFVADGSILPRRSGIDPRPMAKQTAVPFESPDALRTEFHLPNCGKVSGMGIKKGVTLIVGGGYHGKSTLLRALELGIYDHRPDDGRELVVSDGATVKLRAEDGRRVAQVDISPFINNLPHQIDTTSFSTDDASGSTSQAASLIEAVEVGAQVLLIDEDTAATNFMIRDHRMQQLIAKDKEPITPFVDKVRQLYDEHGVSTVLVVGGSGDYFDVADTIIAMEDYLPHDASKQAKAIAAENPTGRSREGGRHFGHIRQRIPIAESVDAAKGRREAKIGARDTRTIQFGRYDIDLSAISQLSCRSQLKAIGQALYYASRHLMDGQRSLSEVLDAIEQAFTARGLDALDRRLVGDYAMFRRFELAAALNRLRSIQLR